MAQATGAHSTYDEPIGTGGNAEDLSSVIRDVSPVDTPVIQMMGTNRAKGTKHEWLTDALAAAADNKHIEGDDATPTDADPRDRLDNQCQIMKKYAVVTGTQEVVQKGGGIVSELSYQMARRLRELKRDMEFAVVGQANAKVAGNDSTAREMGSLMAYLVTNNQLAAGSSAPTGDGTDISDYAGADRALTEAILVAGLQSLYTNSGGNSSVNMIVSAYHKGIVSSFTSAATRYVTTDNKKLTASLDVYEGDFHTVRVIPDRHIQANHSFVLDKEYLKRSILRGVQSSSLAVTGDSIRKQIICEWTIEVCDERAHVMIGDLSTS